MPSTPTTPIMQQAKEWFGDHSSQRKAITLDSTLGCPIATEYFRLHCASELNEENLLAYLELRTLNSLLNGEQVSKKAQEFFRNYLANDAPLELNVASKTMKQLAEQFQKEFNAEAAKQLEKELLLNLQDPFSRFLSGSKKDDFLEECIPMCWFNNAKYSKKLTSADNKNAVLNTIINWSLPARAPHAVAASLLQSIVALVRDHTTSNYHDVNYSKIKEDIRWNRFLQESTELQKVDMKLLTTESEKMSFFINLYNTLLLHATIKREGIPVASINRTPFMRKHKYQVGEETYSLDSIYHGILRRNQKDWIFGLRFSSTDARAKFLVNSIDPRIHFCLGMLNISSPFIVVAPADKEGFEAYLNKQTQAYIDDNVEVQESKKTVVLPALFTWYKTDFGGKGKNQDILKFAAPFLKLSEKQLSSYSVSFAKNYWKQFMFCIAEREKINNQVNRHAIQLDEQTYEQLQKEIVSQVQRSTSFTA